MIQFTPGSFSSTKLAWEHGTGLIALLRETKLIRTHRALGASLAPFGGWLMPIQYGGIISEHTWTRQSASIFDISHMGEFLLRCDASSLGRVVTVNTDPMSIGTCRYGFMLNGDGGIIDDLVVYRIKKDHWMLVVNAATTAKDELHLSAHLSGKAELENISEETGKLDLQGPLARDVMRDLIDPRVGNLGYYEFGHFPVLGEERIISRTGYTGELGYEIYVSGDAVIDLWDLLIQDERVMPGGLGARDTLRLEMSYPLYGQDIDEKTNPIQADLSGFLDMDKDFLGRKALSGGKDRVHDKLRVYFMADTRRAPRHGHKICSKGQEMGSVTSGSFSPSLSCGIGMGYLEKSRAIVGTEIAVRGDRGDLKATLVQKPFYKKGTARQ